MDLRKGSVGDERGEARARGYYASVLALLCVACLLVLAGCSDEIGEARKLETQGDIEGALAIYSEVLKGDADNLEALNGGAVCLLMLKRFDEALALQERLVQLDPTDAQIRVELGFNYLNHQARPADAARVLAEAVRLDPVAKNLCFLAQAQEATGDKRAAEQTLRQAMSEEPGYAYSYRLLAGLLRGVGRAGEADQVLQKAASLGIDVTETS